LKINDFHLGDRKEYGMLAEKIGVKEAVTIALRSVSGLAQIEEETTKSQVGKLVEAIQQLQERVKELKYNPCQELYRKCDIREKKLLGAQSKESRNWP
jgi:hypothetical protein